MGIEPKHHLSEIDFVHKVATCSVCGPGSRIKFNGNGKSRSCLTVYEASRTPVRKLFKNIPRPERCEICYAARALVRDHDHESGKARGWICSQCNQGLGMFKDDPNILEMAIVYLNARKQNADTVAEATVL